jgi:ribosomal protein S18 acetylase RimI-like enzyme
VGAVEIVRWTEVGLPDDVEDLTAEAAAAGYAWAAGFGADWRARPFVDQGEALYLARQHGALLAMAVLSADPFVDDRETGRLRYIYVREAARRQGLAERFVSLCLERARGRWQRLRLHTDNPRAAALYERRGFRRSADDPRATHVLDGPAMIRAES